MRNVNIFIWQIIYRTKFELLFKNLALSLKFLCKKTLMSSVFPSFLISLLMDCQNISVFTITQTSFVKWECKVKTGNRMTYTMNIIRIQILNGLKCLLASILAQDHLDPFFSKQKMTSRSEKKEPNQQLHDMLFIWSEYKESCNGSKQHDKK